MARLSGGRKQKLLAVRADLEAPNMTPQAIAPGWGGGDASDAMGLPGRDHAGWGNAARRVGLLGAPAPPRHGGQVELQAN